jgi:hypothetical protein
MPLPTVTGAEWNRQGITREVFLTRRHAIKIPKLIYGWQKFLCGLLANMQEATFARAGWPELCPVVFSIPGGWLVVMRRAEPLSDAEWAAFDAKAFCERPDYWIPAELKQDSFGMLDGRVVAIDYGN